MNISRITSLLLSVDCTYSQIPGSRTALFQTFTDVYQPAISGNKNRLLDGLKEKTKISPNSKVGQTIKVAKEYWRVEMAPPSPGEMQRFSADLALIKDFIKTGCFNFLTVKQAWLLFLIGLEITLWFYLGETIGKMHIVGYKV